MAQAHRELQPGEHVSWSYGTGQAKGQVVEKLTENKKLGSRVFKASPDDPKYLVKSDTSGKEAIKKPETLHKIDEADTGSEPPSHEEGDARKHEVGAKEKRDHLKERSSKEEHKEDESEELKKVADTGKGSVRASAKAAKSKIKGVAGEGDDALVEDVGEDKDATYEPKKADLQVPDDEEAIATLPTDEEVIAQVEEEVKEEGEKAVDAEVVGEDEGEEEDQTYDPWKEGDVVGDAAEDEEVINTLPPDEELIKQVEKENKEAIDDDAGKEPRKSSGTASKKK